MANLGFTVVTGHTGHASLKTSHNFLSNLATGGIFQQKILLSFLPYINGCSKIRPSTLPIHQRKMLKKFHKTIHISLVGEEMLPNVSKVASIPHLNWQRPLIPMSGHIADETTTTHFAFAQANRGIKMKVWD